MPLRNIDWLVVVVVDDVLAGFVAVVWDSLPHDCNDPPPGFVENVDLEGHVCCWDDRLNIAAASEEHLLLLAGH